MRSFLGTIPLFALLLAAILMPSGCKGQKGFHVGGMGSFHNSWLLNKDDSERENLSRTFTPGTSGGLMVRYYIEYSVAVGFDVLYSFQGQSYRIDRRVEDLDRSTRLLYLKTPLMLEFRTAIGSNSYFKGHFGPYVSMPQAAFRTRNGTRVQAPGRRSWSQAYRSPVFGVMLGLGPGFRLGRGWASTPLLTVSRHPLLAVTIRVGEYWPPEE